MRHKDRSYELTAELLAQYRDAAVQNAKELLKEAALLAAHEYYARAYFLAVSSVEEAGKAVQAFEGLGRNLTDPAVAQRLKVQFEDHSEKVNYAFKPWLQAAPNLRDEVITYVDYMVQLGFGREASMYTDIHAEKGIVTAPQTQIRPEAAMDCVRLASTVLSHALSYSQGAAPPTATRMQDAFFALKASTWRKMASTRDFWEFYVSRTEAGEKELEAVALEYSKQYLSKGLAFGPSQSGGGDDA